jgi:hypothetical protein
MPLLGVTPHCVGAIGSGACADSDANWLQLFEAPGNATRLSALTEECVSSFGCDVWASLQKGTLAHVQAALNREGSDALSARCADPTPGWHPWEDAQRNLQLALGLGGCALLLTLSALVALYLRRRKRSRQQQHQMHAHSIAQQSQGVYRTMA